MPIAENNLVLPRIAAMVYNTPLMLTDAKLQAIMSFLGPRMHGESMLSAAEMRGQSPDVRTEPSEPSPPGSLSVISVDGVMINKARGMDAFSGMTSYESISEQLKAATMDPDTSATVLNLDTPGGMVSGAFDAADLIQEMDAIKPIYAIVSDEANSAGYLLASAARKVFVTQTAMVGSIGVIRQHVDESELNAKIGIKYTSIFSGERKIDFSPNAPLSNTAKALAQKQVDETRMKFAEAVAKGRDMTVAQILDTEAAVYVGQAGVDAGLADMVASVDEAFDHIFEMVAQENDRSTNDMPITNRIPTAATAMSAIEQPAVSDLVLRPAPTAATAGSAAEAPAGDGGIQLAVTAERKRISDIMSLDEAKGREALSRQCIDMGMSVEDSQKLLAAAPEMAAPVADVKPDALALAMVNEPNPDVSANAAADGESPEAELNNFVAGMLASAGVAQPK